MSAPSERTPPTLRRQLAASAPHVSLKAGLRALIVALRAAARGPEVPRHPLASRQALDRVLGQTDPVEPETLVAIKSGLRDLLASGDPRLALELAALLQGCAPVVVAADSCWPVALSARPPQLSDAVAGSLLGTTDGTLRADRAALAVHRLHGSVIGGYAVAVDVALPAGARLPAVPRAERGDRGRWGRAAPWLAALDELGRHSLTPEALARRVAARAPVVPGRVVDACCGCGGSTVAFAEHGAEVVAVELDGGRAALARHNVAARGLHDRVVVHTASIEAVLPSLLTPDDLLYVDPPWVGDDGRATDFATLFRALPRLGAAVATAPAVVLKLPRAFSVDSLPGGASAWDLFYELGTQATGDAQVVRMITAQRPRRVRSEREVPKPRTTR